MSTGFVEKTDATDIGNAAKNGGVEAVSTVFQAELAEINKADAAFGDRSQLNQALTTELEQRGILPELAVDWTQNNFSKLDKYVKQLDRDEDGKIYDDSSDGVHRNSDGKVDSITYPFPSVDRLRGPHRTFEYDSEGNLTAMTAFGDRYHKGEDGQWLNEQSEAPTWKNVTVNQNDGSISFEYEGGRVYTDTPDGQHFHGERDSAGKFVVKNSSGDITEIDFANGGTRQIAYDYFGQPSAIDLEDGGKLVRKPPGDSWTLNGEPLDGFVTVGKDGTVTVYTAGEKSVYSADGTVTKSEDHTAAAVDSLDSFIDSKETHSREERGVAALAKEIGKDILSGDTEALKKLTEQYRNDPAKLSQAIAMLKPWFEAAGVEVSFNSNLGSTMEMRRNNPVGTIRVSTGEGSDRITWTSNRGRFAGGPSDDADLSGIGKKAALISRFACNPTPIAFPLPDVIIN
ncbi:MAG: hypothetical protein IT342_07130 [Candidatus Melainabacteria bacterium]|nr:hypothetical protein [Candidatus Melainabacteria bacterium]